MIPVRTPLSILLCERTPSSSEEDFGYLIAVAPSFSAAARLASDEPDIKTSGTSSAAKCGESLTFLIR
jgi:hypothetical protein